MPERRFFIVFIVTIFATVAALTGLVIAIDPYGLYGSNLAPKINARKYFMSSFERIIKPVTIQRRAPRAVIIGTSRAAVGIRSAALAGHAGETYNFGINGAHLTEIDIGLRIALENGARTVLYGVDYYTFTKRRDELALQMTHLRPGYAWEKLQTYARHTFSLRALLDTATTVWDNQSGSAPSHGPSGQYINYNPTNIPFQAPDVAKRGTFEGAYKIFDAMLALSAKTGTDIRLFISPVFGSHLRSDPIHNAWLTHIRAIARKYGFQIHDFASDPSFASNREDYFDVGHYRPMIGDRIVGIVFGSEKSREN